MKHILMVVYEAPIVAANDVMSMNTKGGGFSFDPLTQIETLAMVLKEK
ncbi:MAG: hypothetical protein IPI90_09590 [Saprospiraceae bacterium]|nr:hypothetical protein [Candidatus Vicinibacter affinis]